MSADLSKIESYISLGDNCEFGFVQRNAGFEPSGLLRWAIAKPIDVVRFLELSLIHISEPTRPY